MARTVEANDRMKEQRRQKILDGALYLFAVRGLAATRISDIAEKCGMSQGLIYHYYSNKGEIFTELIDSAFSRMVLAASGLESMAIPVAEKIALAVKQIFLSLDSDPYVSLYYLLIANATASDAVPDDAKKIIHQSYQIPYDIMERIFLIGQNEGTVKNFPAKELALLFWTSLKGIAIHRAVHGEGFSFPNPDIIVGMFLNENV